MKAIHTLAACSILGVLLSYGCSEPAIQPTGGRAAISGSNAPAAAKAPTVSQEQIDAATKGDVNLKQLPPPRPALAQTPDLSNAIYTVNDSTLASMAKNGVPTEVANNLKRIQGKTFSNTADFVAAAKDAIGQTAMDTHQDTILRSALLVSLAEPPTGPRGQASLDEAAARSAAGAMMMTAMSAKGTDFKIVYFDYDKSNVKPEFSVGIKENAKRLIATKAKMVVEGHCDERGTTEYNFALGQRRAEALRKALIAEGVPSSQLKTISFGEERPVDQGHTEAAWSKNRRSQLTPQ